MIKQREWILFAACFCYSLALFQIGFRLTYEVMPIMGLMVLGAWTTGLLFPYRPWLWALGFGLGTLFPTRPLSEEHIRHERPSKPLPLPLGLTDNPFAQHLAGALLIMAFPFVATMIGYAMGKASSFVLSRLSK